MTDLAPLVRTKVADVPSAGTAGGVVQQVAEAEWAGTISAVSFTPSANVVGNDTNYVTLKVINRGQDGSGTAVAASLALTNAVVATISGGDEKALTIDSARNTVAAGDEIEFTSTPSGGGLAVASGLLQVDITRS